MANKIYANLVIKGDDLLEETIMNKWMNEKKQIQQKKNKKSTQLIYLHKQIDALTNIHWLYLCSGVWEQAQIHLHYRKDS